MEESVVAKRPATSLFVSLLATSLSLTLLLVPWSSSTAVPQIASAETLPQRGAGFRLLETTITDIHGAMRAGQLTCRQLVQMYMDRIEAYDQQGPALTAVQTLNPNALAEADRLDAQLGASGMAGPLHCIPV